MNFLALVNRARRECGATGAPLPNLTDNLTTESLRFKDWVNQAWLDLGVDKPDWEWLREEFSLPVVAGTALYDAADTSVPAAEHWKRDSFRLYRDAEGVAGEQHLPFLDYPHFRDLYLLGAARTQVGRPVAWTLTPQREILLAPLPDDSYTLVGECWRGPVDLVADSDSPADQGLDERFHMLVVYGAMQSYATFEAAPEVHQRAAAEYRRLMNRLLPESLPTIEFGPPLA